MLDVCSQMKEPVRIAGVRMDGIYRKLTVRERPGLVEYDGSGFREGVHKARALDEDAFAGSTAYASEESEGNAYDQGARTGYHQEHQCAVQPGRESLHITVGEQRWHGCQQNGGDNHYRGIDPGEPGDECFTAGFALAGVLYKFDYP